MVQIPLPPKKRTLKKKHTFTIALQIPKCYSKLGDIEDHLPT